MIASMIGDARFIPLKDESVNCIITSPPYWGLRKYDIPDLVWDGDANCEHEWRVGNIVWHGDRGKGTHKEVYCGMEKQESFYNVCIKCNAWKGQLGLEPTIDLYIKHLMQVMDECWRVLRKDGTLWVNLGDSYAGSNNGSNDYRENGASISKNDRKYMGQKTGNNIEGIRDKSLCLIPERFAISMLDRGWILRNKIIWYKRNCMPSSAKDRFTVDFEPIFFFVKSKKYWFEQLIESNNDTYNGKRGKITRRTKKQSAMRTEGYSDYYGLGRNKRCVWDIPTQPYPESHFATFPEALVEPMIRAGCPKEICVQCNTARKLITIRGEYIRTGGKRNKPTPGLSAQQLQGTGYYAKIVSGYTDCGCGAGFKPGIVLDPFCGTGTVVKVAEELGRSCIGIDLGYADLQRKRLSNIQKRLF